MRLNFFMLHFCFNKDINNFCKNNNATFGSKIYSSVHLRFELIFEVSFFFLFYYIIYILFDKTDKQILIKIL